MSKPTAVILCIGLAAALVVLVIFLAHELSGDFSEEQITGGVDSVNNKVTVMQPRQTTPKVIDLARTAKVVAMPVRQTLMRRAA